MKSEAGFCRREEIRRRRSRDNMSQKNPPPPPPLMGGVRFTANRGHCQYGKLSQVNFDQKKSVAVKGTRNFVNLPNLLAVAELNYDRGTNNPVSRVPALCRRRIV